jgi:hypothetical protein
MIQSVLLWAHIAFASPETEEQSLTDLSSLISYQQVSPRVNVAYVPVMSKERNTCVFALTLETQNAAVDVSSIKIAYDKGDMQHVVPLDKHHFPKTDDQFTWYLMALHRNIAIIKTESYGKSGRVIMSRSETGECDFSQI